MSPLTPNKLCLTSHFGSSQAGWPERHQSEVEERRMSQSAAASMNNETADELSSGGLNYITGLLCEKERR